MKKLSFLLVLLFLPLAAAQTECPFGEVNCTGGCGRFIDTDGDGFCDLSEEETAVLESQNTSSKTSANNSTAQNPLTQSQARNYNLIVLVLISAILYGSTYFLVKMKAITIVTHRKIWNMALLISFLISAILGVLLVIRINFGWAPVFPSIMLFYHVEAGIIMAVVSAFHILWHWPYFKSYLKKR
jgi:hypothetical protein